MTDARNVRDVQTIMSRVSRKTPEKRRAATTAECSDMLVDAQLIARFNF